GVDPAPDGIGPALIMRLLLELPSSVPAYFRGLAEQPQMAEALWATLAELRMAGIAAAALPSEAFASAAKHAELRALLEAFERHLVERRLADRAEVYREALLHLDVCPIQVGDLRLELPNLIWSPLERRLLDALPGDRATPRALTLPGLDVPRRMATLAARVESGAPAPASNAERLAALMEPAGPGGAGPPPAPFFARRGRAGGGEGFPRLRRAPPAPP